MVPYNTGSADNISICSIFGPNLLWNVAVHQTTDMVEQPLKVLLSDKTISFHVSPLLTNEMRANLKWAIKCPSNGQRGKTYFSEN